MVIDKISIIIVITVFYETQNESTDNDIFRLLHNNNIKLFHSDTSQ